MDSLPASMRNHRVCADASASVLAGEVRYAPVKSLWFSTMAIAAAVGGTLTFSWAALAVFLLATGTVLLFGHSLGSHRKLIHDSFACPLWLERVLVYLGVQVGLAGPIGLLRQHELRDFAQRLPDCHPYLRHGSGFWRDAWWQLHCELVLEKPPTLALEPRIANDRFLIWLERTWMLQQLPPALVLYLLGGWAFVFWGVCGRITAGVAGHWLVGYFAHNHGPMHHVVDGAAVQGHNVRWTSLLTMGESWHNNHHGYPGSARLGLAPGEWDPGWWALVLLQRAGLVRNLRLPQHLPDRMELRRLHTVPLRDQAVATATVQRLWQLSREGAPAPELRGPAASLPGSLLARCGRFTVNRGARRLSVRVRTETFVGLPALWLAFARRSRAHRWLAALLLPLACGAEQLRALCTEPRPA